MRILVAAFAIALVACGAPAPRGPGIDVDRALATVDALATQIGPRPESTEASRRAAAWIETQLADAGIQAERFEVGTVELPGIEVMGARYRDAHTVTVTDPNLVVRLGTGDGPALLIMAHYDSVPNSPGAVDNAAAVGVLLELARTWNAEPPPQPVMLVFTAAEEVGLVGAEALAAEVADRVSFAIALDLVGGSGQLVVNGASERIGTSELRWLLAAADRGGVDLGVPAAHRVVSRWWPQAERSDHGPFTRRGTRAVHFYHRGQDGEWIDRAYHSARDVPSRVSRAAVGDVGRLLRALASSPVPAHSSDGMKLPLSSIVVPRMIVVAIEALLVLVVVGALVLSRAGLLAYLGRSRDDRRGPALLAGIACYAAAVALAIVIERATQDATARWLHAPLRATLGATCVIGGAFGLVTRALARWFPWRGEARYLAVATIMLVAIGTMWLALGAAELAWVWLVPAAAIAIAPGLPRPFAWLSVAVTALPAALVLHPDRLREAAWNAFLPTGVPLAATVGLLGIPFVAALAWALRRRASTGPMGTLALGVGCSVLVCLGLVAAVTAPAPCTHAEFVTFRLGCERV